VCGRPGTASREVRVPGPDIGGRWTDGIVGIVGIDRCMQPGNTVDKFLRMDRLRGIVPISDGFEASARRCQPRNWPNNTRGSSITGQTASVLGRMAECSRKPERIAECGAFKGVDSVGGFATLLDPQRIPLRDAGNRAFFDKSAVGMPRGCFARQQGHGSCWKRKSRRCHSNDR
jgi:hypothetical protein